MKPRAPQSLSLFNFGPSSFNALPPATPNSPGIAGSLWCHLLISIIPIPSHNPVLQRFCDRYSAIRTFQQSLHLVLWPDDIWLSILTRFSFYVNAHAEEPRNLFVTHEGKRELVFDDRPVPVQAPGVGKLAQKMTKLIEMNVVETKLRAWIMPSFTTTNDNDRPVATVMMMGTLQNTLIVSCSEGVSSHPTRDAPGKKS